MGFFKRLLVILGILAVIASLGVYFFVSSQNEQKENASENEENRTNVNTESPGEAPENKQEVEEDEEISEVRLSAVGDVMVHDTQLISAYEEQSDSYNFETVFDDIRPIISGSDLAIANLETTLSGSAPYSGYPVFNTPDSIVDALAYAGFDTLITANNHSLDTQAEGLKRTARVVKEKGLDAVGTYEEEADSRILIKEIKGIKIAVLAYTEMINKVGASYTDEEIDSMINVINENQIITDLNNVKEEDPDIILTYMHWGEEYARETSNLQKTYSELLAREGVDIILGSHPHVIQSSKFIEVDGNKTYVAYSLGNFLSNQRKETLGEGGEFSEDGVILNIDIQKNNETEETTVQNVEYIPTWVYRYEAEEDTEFDYRILPIEASLENPEFSEEVVARMKNSYEETMSRIGLD